MNIFQIFITRHKQRVIERNSLCDNYISRIEQSLKEINLVFSDTNNFIEPKRALEWQENNNDLISEIEISEIKRFKKADNFKLLLKTREELCGEFFGIKQRIFIHNDKVANEKIHDAYSLIGNVENRKLDKQQMYCIVKTSHNHLVVAGAGTGKTTTVIGKIKYLLKTGSCKPEDILVLSFTNASAAEMNERIKQETGYNIEASTFHKLGLNIITSVNEIVPKITQINMRKFVKEQLLLNMESEEYLKNLSSYLLYNRITAKSEFDFKTQAEYNEYLRLNPPVTIKNETVKSYGELDIANFLVQNGINYIYEHPYEIDTRTDKYRQYIPDFYLPDYNIYIEYFGINRNGDVPKYFAASHGMSASQVYNKSMEWKRKIHKSNNTVLIECYAYEKFEGILLKNLEKNLKNSSVKFQPKTAAELWSQISSDGETVLEGIVELFETVINLIKSNNYTINDVRSLNKNNSNIQNNNTILSLIEPIFDAYCLYLKEHQEIDFNDMINIASQYVKDRKYINPYKYVIVDEYQDIAKSRFLLLKNLRDSYDYDLFCVGDDWQSIYRFAGSDIGFILNFEKYWGASETSKIETTYRFSQKLIEISSGFIMQNPMQITKNIKGHSDSFVFPLGEINGYTPKLSIEFMLKRLSELPRGSTVYFIGRYSFDLDLLKENETLSCNYNNQSGFVEVKYSKRPDLAMRFVTAHKSKGLQADYVFIINNKKSRMGFPSKIQDAAILDLLLDNCDSYPFAEERRLFYVALTRAKKQAFLVTIKNQESEFVNELKAKYYTEIKNEPFTCPRCGGRLIKKTGIRGEFWGCVNYRTKNCTYTRNLK